MGMDKNCDNCIHSGKPSYEYPCTACETAYGSAPSKWESMVSVTADMVEVVRCKDCKKRDTNLCPLCHCVSPMINSMDDDFCSYGKKII